MDTSILSRLFDIAPDLMEEVELRALVLERVAALGPIGRRALAERMHLAERKVRAASEALRGADCIVQSAAGMELTERGRNLIDTARMVSRSRRMLSSMETALARALNAERVRIVHGDADRDSSVMSAAAEAAAQQMRQLLYGVHTLAVSGGEMVAQTAEALAPAAPMELTVVPAQGGTGASIRVQANTLAEEFAKRLGGHSRMLHLPEELSPEAAKVMLALPQVREVLELARGENLIFYEIDGALSAALRRGAGMPQRENLLSGGAVGEALGFYFDAKGRIVSAKSAYVLREQELSKAVRAAAIAVGHSRAEAIMAVCTHHPHRLLVTDEGAAHRIMELSHV